MLHMLTWQTRDHKLPLRGWDVEARPKASPTSHHASRCGGAVPLGAVPASMDGWLALESIFSRPARMGTTLPKNVRALALDDSKSPFRWWTAATTVT